jgi:hypothetical protein
MNVVLISTTDVKNARDAVWQRMLASMVESKRTLGESRVRLCVVLQNCSAAEFPAYAAKMPDWVLPLAIASRVSLSRARNLALERLLDDGEIEPDTVVAFPDDDCWYPAGFLRQVVELFERETELDFWICRYGSQPVMESFAHGRPALARTREVVRNASSNTMFLRGRVVSSIGEFDEGLGVGTPMGGSEDLDYALRASRASRQTAYLHTVLVGHRDKSPEIRARYYLSSLTVLARHAKYGATGEFLRKIAVGAYLVLRNELAARDYFGALNQVRAKPAKGDNVDTVKHPES